MQRIRISDAITTARIVSVGLLAISISFYPTLLGWVPGLIIIFIVFMTDTLDGIVARTLKEQSKFGAFYDIVGDRIYETAMLIPFVYLHIASPVLLIYFVLKNFLIDFQRFMVFANTKNVPFKQLQNPISKFLVSSSFMRSTYSISKIAMILVFYTLIFFNTAELTLISTIISVITIIVSLLRALPTFLAK